MASIYSDRDERYSFADRDGRKRVSQACDRCRLKKIKCDGNIPCGRCKLEDAYCTFGARRKGMDRSVPAGYIDQLELQQKILVKALKETWKVYVMADDQVSDDSVPSVHAIVEKLGFLTDGRLQHSPPGAFSFHGDRKDSLSSCQEDVFEDESFSPTLLPQPWHADPGRGSVSTNSSVPSDHGCSALSTRSGSLASIPDTEPDSFSSTPIVVPSDSSRAFSVGAFGLSYHDPAADFTNGQPWENLPPGVAGMQAFSSTLQAQPPELVHQVQLSNMPTETPRALQGQGKGRTKTSSKSLGASNERRSRTAGSSAARHAMPRTVLRGPSEEVTEENWHAWINDD